MNSSQSSGFLGLAPKYQVDENKPIALLSATGLISSSGISGCDRRNPEFCSSSIASAMNSSQSSGFLGLAPKYQVDENKPIALLSEEELPFAAPYTFMKLADFVYNEEEPFEPAQVFEGAVVYAVSTQLSSFFTMIHTHIKNRYILITHGADPFVPGRYVKYLNSCKIIAWLGRNPSVKPNKKFHPIPIGINARTQGAAEWAKPIYDRLLECDCEKEHLLYLNFDLKTNKSARGEVYDLFHSKPYCFCSEKKPMEEYLLDLKKSHFVLSPTGNGLDCFRTWEAMLMGSIPIVQTSKLDPLLEDLPVLIVDDWKIINQKYLKAKKIEFEKKRYSLEKIYISYWKEYIHRLLKEAGIENDKS